MFNKELDWFKDAPEVAIFIDVQHDQWESCIVCERLLSLSHGMFRDD